MSDAHYTVRMIEGCTAFDTTVDDKSWHRKDNRFQDKEAFIHALANEVARQLMARETTVEEVLRSISEEGYGSNEYSCDSCGDTVHWVDYKIPKTPRPVGVPWDRAPEWANFAAMDSDGAWFWYENKPGVSLLEHACHDPGNRAKRIMFEGAEWQSSLQERPA